MARLGNRLPTCMACLRRLAQPSSSPIQHPTTVVLVQTRAKSNYTRPYDRGVVVRLLEDIPTFGRKNAVFRTERGRMRNQWYPANKAEYMTRQRFKELGLTEEDVGERDRAFGVVNQVDEEADLAEAIETPTAAPNITPELTLETAHSLISMLVPQTLTFYRKPIEKTTSKTEEEKPEEDASGLGIYGSVSTADIANRIKEFLATDFEGSQIALEPENITIFSVKEESRVKSLGRWEVEIHLGTREDDALAPVRKVIEVLPEVEGQEELNSQ